MTIRIDLPAFWNGPRLRRLSPQLSAFFSQIEKLAGMQSACVCDNHGELLGAIGPTALDNAVYTRLGQLMCQLLAVLETQGRKPKELDLLLDHQAVLVRDLGNAFVMVLCVPQLDRALLRLTLNVAALPFEKDADLQGLLREAAPLRRDVLTENALDAAAWELVQRMDLSTLQ